MKTFSVIKYGINGEGIAYEDHKPVFIPGALAGETVEAEIVKSEERYARAELKKVITPSEDRIAPICPYAAKCGACALSHIQPAAQAAVKKQILSETLDKYAHIPDSLIRDVHTDHQSWGYRSQCKLPVQSVSGKLCTGLYETGTNHFVPIRHCRMHTPELERLRIQVLDLLNEAGIRAFDHRTHTGLRYLVLRTIQGRSQCTLVTGRETIPMDLVMRIMALDTVEGVFQSVNTNRKTNEIFGRDTVRLAGNDTITVNMHGISLQLSPRSFFQLNVPMAEKLYETAVAKIDPCTKLTEAYCGVGAMSLLARDKASCITGIEAVPEAIDNARANAEANHIENVKFICADAAEGLEKDTDTLLADPPRRGMDDAMIRAVLSSDIKKIVYISCNPASLGKNLHALSHAYHPVTIIPFDLFPDTPHIETIAVLVRNGTRDSVKRSHRKYRHALQKKRKTA